MKKIPWFAASREVEEAFSEKRAELLKRINQFTADHSTHQGITFIPHSALKKGDKGILTIPPRSG